MVTDSALETDVLSQGVVRALSIFKWLDKITLETIEIDKMKLKNFLADLGLSHKSRPELCLRIAEMTLELQKLEGSVPLDCGIFHPSNDKNLLKK
ncbi:hypothetical protein TNCV_95501 [Trichonephila clavipes]|nr:hypothetical protein TNCV_95501 [Trichonephila clavipes]